jgi:pimeloyl-ACP methyl ester carboxylesterase
VRIFYDRFDPIDADPASRRTPVLLLNHLATNRRMWTPAAMEGMRRGHPVIAVDGRGCGRSDAPLRPWSTTDMAHDALAVLDHAGVGRAHVCGISLGGLIAQEIAIRFPERTAALVLMATFGGAPRMDLMSMVQLNRISLAQMRTGGSREAAARRVLGELISREFAAAVEPGDPAWELVNDVLDEPVRKRGVLGQVLAGSRHASWGRLKRIQAPTQVQHGTADTLFPVRAGELLAERIRGAEFVALDGLGHGLVFQDPDLCLSHLFDFVARHDAALSEPLPEAEAEAAPGQAA